MLGRVFMVDAFASVVIDDLHVMSITVDPAGDTFFHFFALCDLYRIFRHPDGHPDKQRYPSQSGKAIYFMIAS